ncbi:MAG: hypothetical protein H6Q06_1756 [Acidobacteria bacterium]|nr:hypothetical protein [Acidobacteriota bacterium]
MSVRVRHLLAGCMLAVTVAGVLQARVGTRKPAAEDGEFVIFFGAREIGSEKFAIQAAAESVTSSSVLEFRNPATPGQKVRMETKLEMNGDYVPRAYLLKTDVDGVRGSITGSFAPNQVMFDFEGKGTNRRSGLLLPSRYTMLDSNIYHHFIFLVRLFDFDSRDGTAGEETRGSRPPGRFRRASVAAVGGQGRCPSEDKRALKGARGRAPLMRNFAENLKNSRCRDRKRNRSRHSKSPAGGLQDSV